MKCVLFSLCILFLIHPSQDLVLRATQEANPGTPVPITPLAPKRTGPRDSFTAFSGIGEPLRLVIREQDAWREIWKRIHRFGPFEGPNSEIPSLPEVDFSREMIVVAASGSRPSGGYTVIIEAAHERNNQVEIAVRSISPGKNCASLSVVTAPVDLVRLPKTERSIVFRETEVRQNCSN